MTGKRILCEHLRVPAHCPISKHHVLSKTHFPAWTLLWNKNLPLGILRHSWSCPQSFCPHLGYGYFFIFFFFLLFAQNVTVESLVQTISLLVKNNIISRFWQIYSTYLGHNSLPQIFISQALLNDHLIFWQLDLRILSVVQMLITAGLHDCKKIGLHFTGVVSKVNHFIPAGDKTFFSILALISMCELWVYFPF